MDKSIGRRRAPNHPTGAQIRAARALLNLSAAELATRTGLALNTVRKAESTDELAPITAANAGLIVQVLVSAGIQFVPADKHGGDGVRFVASRGDESLRVD